MKIGMISLGCPKNLVDSEVMLGLARQEGHELTRDPADADVLIVNTCAFIDTAKQESIDAILEMAEHKKGGACRRLVVAGCLAERYREELLEQIPEIDAVVGTGEVPQIVEAIVGSTEDRRTRIIPLRQVGQSRPRPTYIYDADTPRLFSTPRHYAYVKVAEGCNYTCAFCIIPTLRGRYRSRPVDSIVREVESLVSQGVKEVLLVSQDTSFYGVDRGERGGLARLLRALNDVSGLEWIRMLYLYPTTIGDNVLDAMAESGKVCRYIDLPLQHAASAVLRRMRRPGSRATYERLLDRIRRHLPGVTLRTTFIVGFPGETEADFAELQSFVRGVEFDHVGVFTYSHEDGTQAWKLPDDVPVRTKERRRDRLMSLQRGVVARAQCERIGQRVRLLVDGPSPEHELVWRGRLESQAPDIDPLVYLTDCDPSEFRPGLFVDAEITGSQDYDLIARPAHTSVASVIHSRVT